MRLTELEAGAGALAEYYDWFKDARTGDVLVYWKGDLRFDRGLIDLDQDWRTRTPVSQLDALCLRIMKDASENYLLLNQRKLGNGRYEYRATRQRSVLEKALDVRRARYEDLVQA